MDKMALEQVVFWVSPVSPYNHFSTIAPYSSITAP
jgi:hypothetical protein